MRELGLSVCDVNRSHRDILCKKILWSPVNPEWMELNLEKWTEFFSGKVIEFYSRLRDLLVTRVNGLMNILI